MKEIANILWAIIKIGNVVKIGNKPPVYLCLVSRE